VWPVSPFDNGALIRRHVAKIGIEPLIVVFYSGSKAVCTYPEGRCGRHRHYTWLAPHLLNSVESNLISPNSVFVKFVFVQNFHQNMYGFYRGHVLYRMRAWTTCNRMNSGQTTRVSPHSSLSKSAFNGLVRLSVPGRGGSGCLDTLDSSEQEAENK
jgi:hypothetical protein